MLKKWLKMFFGKMNRYRFKDTKCRGVGWGDNYVVNDLTDHAKRFFHLALNCKAVKNKENFHIYYSFFSVQKTLIFCNIV